MQSRRYAFGGLLLVIALWPLVGSGQNGMSNGQWRAYSADEGSTRYSSLDQVTKENVKNLQVAWTWKFDNFGTPAETVTTETTPLMVDGTGMCGGCRVMVGGKAQFACVDGPAFDAHEVDFEVANRLANSEGWPEWLPGNEFKATREASLKGK